MITRCTTTTGQNFIKLKAIETYLRDCKRKIFTEQPTLMPWFFLLWQDETEISKFGLSSPKVCLDTRYLYNALELREHQAPSTNDRIITQIKDERLIGQIEG